MKRTSDQLNEEETYPNLAAFVRSGGMLEVGKDRLIGTFARIRKGNRTATVDTVYRDFAAVLNEMEAKAKEFMNAANEHLRTKQ